LSFPKRPDWLWGRLASYSLVTWTMRPGRGADHPPSL